MTYRVRYRSEGVLSGYEPHDEVRRLDDLDAQRLLDLGIIETEEDYQKRTQKRTKPTESKAGPKTEAKTQRKARGSDESGRESGT